MALKSVSPQPESEFAGLERRLDTVVRLLSAQLTKGMTKKDAILALSALGLTPKEVAGILDVSSNQVSVEVYQAKKKAKKSAKKKAEGGD